MTAQPTKTKYYKVRGTRSDRGSGWDLLNRDRLQAGGGISPNVAWPDGALVLPRGPWNIPQYLEPPHFVFANSSRRTPPDFAIKDGFFLISCKMREIFQDLAGENCEYVVCKTQYRNGESGPERWLCSVTQAYRDAVDLKASANISLSVYGTYLFPIFEKIDLAFKAEIIGSAHVFRLAEYATSLFCDQEFKDRCKSSDIRGISFEQIGSAASQIGGR